MTSKIDFSKTLDSYKAKQGVFSEIEVPQISYLMVDGHGDPNTAQQYLDAVAALYKLAYGLKFYSKRSLDRDYVVPPLEGLWWANDMAAFTSARDKSTWDWTMMIMTPDWLGYADFENVRAENMAKLEQPKLAEVRLEKLTEGFCVQTLHLGPYDDEAPLLAQLHDEYIPQHNLQMVGKHHEIYLGDPRKAAPERLRTILRQPVARVM